jgi:hypothetical protein
VLKQVLHDPLELRTTYFETLFRHGESGLAQVSTWGTSRSHAVSRRGRSRPNPARAETVSQRHEIEKKGHYAASVESKGGKIAAFHVPHDTNGEIPVKKYKTHKKMVQATGSHLTYASFTLPQDTDLGTVYIGYSYIDDEGNEEIYWFPEEEILDGDTGQSSTFQ